MVPLRFAVAGGVEAGDEPIQDLDPSRDSCVGNYEPSYLRAVIAPTDNQEEYVWVAQGGSQESNYSDQTGSGLRPDASELRAESRSECQSGQVHVAWLRLHSVSDRR